MPGLNLLHEQQLRFPKVAVSIEMLGRIVILLINSIIIGIIGYYFAYHQGSFRHSLFHPELMMLVCSVACFINTVITVKIPLRRVFASLKYSRFQLLAVELPTSKETLPPAVLRSYPVSSVPSFSFSLQWFCLFKYDDNLTYFY